MSIRTRDTLRSLVVRRSRELGKSMTILAKEAGISRTYLYGLAGGASQDPSVRTLIKLAKALRVSPLMLFRYFADLAGAPVDTYSMASTNRAIGLHDPSDIAVFNADVSTPDQAVVLPGEIFQKTWEIQNLGTRPWRDRRLVRVDGEYVIARRTATGTPLEVVMDTHLRSLNNEIPIAETLPGQPVHLTVEFAAPKETCTVTSIWRIEDEQGKPCYGPAFILHVIVNVMAR
ncbi:helix-turn-helix domain-containing protein [Pseudomonas palleroniana]|uniref:Helix-turn-helix domain-containing protein n=2 Tax=Pseudomonas palleroniana TaxID=191390 RepID=A0A0X7K5X5_9PSED|nr:NBR1-Ig-like domain-containing protein [Pseudomonas palleroniana]KAB0563509.1 helix-turn-helix domain-containing protein [Pseudomonas palleroniana]KWU51006.1 transcriptional regulator [Pseudomonas palleroniana]PTC23530.1 helix-turn-helix domain-containing protein [Pseudomonas palleroniana]